MGDPGLTPEVALQLTQALLYWMAALLLGLACLAALTALVFVWRECFRPIVTRLPVQRNDQSSLPHPVPEPIEPGLALLPVLRIALTTRAGAGRNSARKRDAE